MNLIAFIRGIGEIIRGGATSREIFLGIFLGFSIGMLPGINLTVFAFLLLLLIMNASLSIAIVALLAGNILCLLLAPVTYSIGYFFIHGVGLEFVIRIFSNTPILALLDLHVYSLLGAMPFIIVAFFVAKWITSLFVKMRVAIVAANENNQKLQKLGEKKLVRATLWLLFGGKEDGTYDTARTVPLFSKTRIVIGIIIFAIIATLQIMFLGNSIRKTLEFSISAITGAEVNIEKVSISLFSDTFELKGLQVTDPDYPGNNSVQSENIIANISVTDLLAKRLVFDQMSINGMKLDAPRKKPGELYNKKQSPGMLPKLQDIDLQNAAEKLKAYYTKLKDLKEKFDKIKSYLETNDKAKKDKSEEETDITENITWSKYLKLSAKDSLAKNPAWVINKVEINNMEVSRYLPSFTVKAENLSSSPSLLGKEMSFDASVNDEELRKWAGDMAVTIDEMGETLKDTGGKITDIIKGWFE